MTSLQLIAEYRSLTILQRAEFWAAVAQDPTLPATIREVAISKSPEVSHENN